MSSQALRYAGRAFLLATWFLISCGDKTGRTTPLTETIKRRSDINVIEGKDQVLDSVAVQQGQVLVAYSDCYTCHAVEQKAKGPAFTAIAARYPANAGYIELLANKIIAGGKGAWGNVVMEPHPDVLIEDARKMASFILSLDASELDVTP